MLKSSKTENELEVIAVYGLSLLNMPQNSFFQAAWFFYLPINFEHITVSKICHIYLRSKPEKFKIDLFSILMMFTLFFVCDSFITKWNFNNYI